MKYGIRTFLITILVLGILMIPLTSAYCKNRVSKTVTLSLRVVSREELNTDTVEMDKKPMDGKDTRVSKAYRDGEEVILMTKVSE